jgi:predicted nuclease with TOPRIM domain
MSEHQNASDRLEDLKTDETELEEVLDRYDLDEALEAEFNALEERFKQLQIRYQSLLNTERLFQNG